VADLKSEFVAAGFQYADDDAPSPRAFIQWKGTDVCMDFHCDCGAHCHFDGYFAYAVKCPHCGAVWEMPYMAYPRKMEKENNPHWADNPKPLEPDEDYCDDAGNPFPVPTDS